MFRDARGDRNDKAGRGRKDYAEGSNALVLLREALVFVGSASSFCGEWSSIAVKYIESVANVRVLY